jgi:hypothetical protein
MGALDDLISSLSGDGVVRLEAPNRMTAINSLIDIGAYYGKED